MGAMLTPSCWVAEMMHVNAQHWKLISVCYPPTSSGGLTREKMTPSYLGNQGACQIVYHPTLTPASEQRDLHTWSWMSSTNAYLARAAQNVPECTQLSFPLASLCRALLPGWGTFSRGWRGEGRDSLLDIARGHQVLSTDLTEPSLSQQPRSTRVWCLNCPKLFLF